MLGVGADASAQGSEVVVWRPSSQGGPGPGLLHLQKLDLTRKAAGHLQSIACLPIQLSLAIIANKSEEKPCQLPC